jgi:hypothetical protein
VGTDREPAPRGLADVRDGVPMRGELPMMRYHGTT